MRGERERGICLIQREWSNTLHQRDPHKEHNTTFHKMCIILRSKNLSAWTMENVPKTISLQNMGAFN